MNKIYLFLALLSLTACNTMEGLNKDLKKGGDQIKKSAQQVGKSLKTE